MFKPGWERFGSSRKSPQMRRSLARKIGFFSASCKLAGATQPSPMTTREPPKGRGGQPPVSYLSVHMVNPRLRGLHLYLSASIPEEGQIEKAFGHSTLCVSGCRSTHNFRMQQDRSQGARCAAASGKDRDCESSACATSG